MSQGNLAFNIEADADGEISTDWFYDLPSVAAFQIKNTGANPITSLVLQVQNHEDADFFDFISDEELIEDASGFYYVNPEAANPHLIGPGETINYAIKLLSGYRFRWKATSPGGTTVEFLGLTQPQVF